MKATVVMDRSRDNLNLSALTDNEERGVLQEKKSNANFKPSHQNPPGKFGFNKYSNTEDGVRLYYP